MSLTVTVLQAVYSGDRADWLCESLESLCRQTRMPDVVLLVKDGGLTPELEACIGQFENRLPLTVIGYTEPKGLSHALNYAIPFVQTDVVMRMDSDDCALPGRLEKQIAQFEVCPDLQVLGTGITEFYETESGSFELCRLYPKRTTGKTLSLFKGTPLAHPTVMLRTELLRRYGYDERTGCNEDIDLWFRMLLDGVELRTLQEPLLRFRITDRTFRRRGIKKSADECRIYFQYLFRLFGINWRFLYVFARFFLRLIHSPRLSRAMYTSSVRKSLFKESVMNVRVLSGSVFVKEGHVFEPLLEIEENGTRKIKAVQLDSHADVIVEVPADSVTVLPLKSASDVLLEFPSVTR